MYFQCRNLVNLDIGSLTDPVIVVQIREENEPAWSLVGETETQQNTLNPNFTETLNINYQFEKTQIILFEVFNQDASKRQFVGKAETTAAELMSSKMNKWSTDLLNKKG